ncbi:MAG: HAD family hydrolase [Saccharofermentans sp.]|nr:HAD family hydrolase [Saccharofermentans sp.]
MRAIIFDIDDTLYSRQDLFVRAASEITGTDIRKYPTFVDTFYKMSDLNTEQLEKGLITTLESNSWRFNKTYEALGIQADEDAGIKTARLYSELQSRIELTKGFETLLVSLKTKAELAILTAGASDHQWDKYDQLGMERFIPRDKVIVAGDVGCSKPELKIFRITEGILDQKDRDKIFMVGDSYKHDILGAVNAGWNTIWINRRQKQLSNGQPGPTFEVNTEPELIKLLGELFL